MTAGFQAQISPSLRSNPALSGWRSLHIICQPFLWGIISDWPTLSHKVLCSLPLFIIIFSVSFSIERLTWTYFTCNFLPTFAFYVIGQLQSKTHPLFKYSTWQWVNDLYIYLNIFSILCLLFLMFRRINSNFFWPYCLMLPQNIKTTT